MIIALIIAIVLFIATFILDYFAAKAELEKENENNIPPPKKINK